MDVKELGKEGLKVSYEVSLGSEELKAIKNKKLQDISKKVTIQGFRTGKAPMDKVESQYGNKVIPEVLEDATNDAIDNIYKEKNLSTVGSPKVSVKDFSMENGLVITVEVELFPDIAELDFSTIILDKKVIEVSDKEISDSLEQMASYYKTFEDILEDREIKNGDVAVIDFIGKVDDVEFEGGKGTDFPLELGSNMFIPGFEEQLIGKKVGEKVMVNVAFPKDYHAQHLAGKNSIFEVDIKKMQQAIKSPIDDELAKKSGFDNLEALKKDIVAKYSEHAELLERNSLKKQIIEKLQDTKDFDLPASLIEVEKEALWNEFENFKKHMQEHESKEDFHTHGHSEAEISSYKKNETEVRKEHEETSRKRIKVALLLNNIATKNEIRIEEKDIQEALSKEAMMYGGNTSSIMSHYQQNKDAMRGLQNRALEDKIISFILAKVSFNEIKMTFEDYTKILSK